MSQLDLDELEAHLNDVELLGLSDLTTDMVLALIARVRELEAAFEGAKAWNTDATATIQSLKEALDEAERVISPFADHTVMFSEIEDRKNRKVVAMDMSPCLEGDVSECEHDEWPDAFRVAWAWRAKRNARALAETEADDD